MLRAPIVEWQVVSLNLPSFACGGGASAKHMCLTVFLVFVVDKLQAFVLASRDGMSDDELLWSMKVPRMGAFSTLLLAMREQLCTRSAFMTFFHDDARFVLDVESGKCRTSLLSRGSVAQLTVPFAATIVHTSAVQASCRTPGEGRNDFGCPQALGGMLQSGHRDTAPQSP